LAKKEEETKYLSVQITMAAWEKLDAIAKERGRTKDSIYKEVVAKGLELLENETETKS